jgi:hypothetical protein
LDKLGDGHGNKNRNKHGKQDNLGDWLGGMVGAFVGGRVGGTRVVVIVVFRGIWGFLLVISGDGGRKFMLLYLSCSALMPNYKSLTQESTTAARLI